MAMMTCSKPLDPHNIARRVQGWFDDRNFESKMLRDEGAYIVKARKSSKWRAVMGADRALNVIIGHNESGGTQVEVKQGDWTTNIVSNAAWLLVTGGANMAISGWSFVLQKQLQNYIQSIFDEAYFSGD